MRFIIIFWLVMSGTQAWITRNWLDINIEIWIGINILALLAGVLIFWGTYYVVVKGVPGIGCLLNLIRVGAGNQSALYRTAALIASVVSSIIMSLIQLLMLRRRITTPVLWALWTATNVVGMGLFMNLGMGISLTQGQEWNFLIFSILAGSVVGAFSGALMSLFVRDLFNFW